MHTIDVAYRTFIIFYVCYIRSISTRLKFQRTNNINELACKPNILHLVCSFMKRIRLLKVFHYTNSLLKGNIFYTDFEISNRK
jgi:hypothetical protein